MNFQHKNKICALAGAIALIGRAEADPATSGADSPERIVITHSAGSRPVLRDEIVATESLSAAEIERSGATMLTETLDKHPGIAVQTECSICNVRNVVLNNLPGRFTTLMIDGVPIFSSVSSAYGLDSVSLGGLERIDISRGAGTSLIAPEALAGSVNLVTRRPAHDEFKANQQIGSFGSQNTDVFAAKTFKGGAITINANRNHHDTVDGDGNGVSEYTGYHRSMGGLGLFADDIGGFQLKGRLDVVSEKRMGGAMGDDYGAVKGSSTGNPFNWSQGASASPDSAGWLTPSTGTLIPYNDGLGGMSEIIFTDRTQFVGSGTRKLGAGSMRIALGVAEHKQDSFYEKATYAGKQSQYYLELSTRQPIGSANLTLGANYRYEDLNSHGTTDTGERNDGIDNYKYRTPGGFAQYYQSLFDERLEFNGSVRYDKHNVFGGITSPRANFLWHHTHELSSRIALGRGFRAPTSFFEQDHGILDTTRIVRDIDKPETSDNASYAFAYAGDRASWVASLNWNKIKNMALLDPGKCSESGTVQDCTGSATEQPVTLFTSANTPVTVKGADLTVSYKITPTLLGTFAAEHFDYSFSQAGTLAFARPSDRVYLTLDYEGADWDAMIRGSWTGPQDLAKFYDYANNPRYNMDGSPKMSKSPSFWVFDARAEYHLNKQWSVYAGADNIFDWKQTDKESQLWIDSKGSLDVTQIWGPNRGRFIYAGIKVDLDL